MTQPPDVPDPTQNPYGQPPPPAYPTSTPQPAPYGQAPAPQGAYAGTPYGQAPAAGAPAGEPSKAMATWSLVLAILFFIPFAWIVSVVLGIIVLSRSRSGRAGGRGLAVAALVIDLLTFLATAALIVVAVVVGVNATSINDLDTGDCINVSGLTDSDDDVSDLETVGCGKAHDAEVVGTVELSADQADGYGDSRANELCMAAVINRPSGLGDTLSIVGLTESLDPDSGDTLACVAYRRDGDRLTAPLG